MTVDEPALADAKAKIGAEARRTISSLSVLRAQAQALMAAPVQLRELARERTAGLTDSQVRQRLRAMPVSSLREVMGRGARLGQLESAGYTTVDAVASKTLTQLLAIPGVGPASAQQIATAAETLRQRVAADTQVRFDADRRSSGQAELLAILSAIKQADSVTSSIREPLERLDAEVTPLLDDAKRAGSRWSMTFAGRAKKRAALSALARLDAILAQTGSLRKILEQGTKAADPASYRSERLWQDYRTEAATFNALLSTVGGAGESKDKEAVQGFVSEDLRKKISETPLDTSLLTATLRSYQVFGAQYAIHQRRSILGDEMGLGKTVQALAVLTHLAANGQNRFLVVCPASVQINWLNEIAKHTKLAAHSLHGTDRDAAAARWNRDGGIAVTTFGTVAKLNLAAPTCVIVDEAHYVKNPGAKRSQVVKTLTDQAPRVLFLTGTPMENRVGEFRNLVGYLQPQLTGRVVASDALVGATAFRRVVASVYLRRNQEDVLRELPDKIEVEDWVQLSPRDYVEYRRAVESGNLMKVRQAAFASEQSTKLERLHEIVTEAGQDGLKVLVFSNFLGVLNTISERIGEAVVGQINGSVQPAARQALINTFTSHQGHAVLLSQIEAGGVGLNVQAASVVILAEPQWKPSTEEQAIARSHRMGQTRKVQVHRLLAKDSVDERIREIQEGKTLLFDEFARKSDAKHVDGRAMDPAEHRPEGLEQRVMEAERTRLGL